MGDKEQMSNTPPRPRQLKETVVGYKAEPTWEIAYLFPPQGTWSEWEYMELRPSRVVEYDHGYLEIHDVPSQSHQLILLYLYNLLSAFVSMRKLGLVLVAPLRVKLWEEKFREPDIVFMSIEHAARRDEDYWLGADLVMEVVSEGEQNRERDLQKKRADYAQGGIPEYWIVDPQLQSLTVLRLNGNEYIVHGEFRAGETASSVLLTGFAIEVTAVFASAKQ